MTDSNLASTRTERLLRVLVGLVAVLVVLFVGASVLAFREYVRFRSLVKKASGTPLASLQEDAPAALRAVAQRQATLAAAMNQRADQTARELAALQKRREGIGNPDKGPLDQMAQLVQLNQLMADEMLLLLKHTTYSQNSLAEAMRPFRGVDAKSGTGGSGAPPPSRQ